MEDSIRNYKIRQIKRRICKKERNDEDFLQKEDIKWVTSNGEHIPINKKTNIAVGPVQKERKEKLVLSNAESLPLSRLRKIKSRSNKNGNTPAERKERQELKKLESDYKKAVESNDIKTAGELVKEFAERSGYSVATYHGTPHRFTAFKRFAEGIHTGTLEQASSIASEKALAEAPKVTRTIGTLLSEMEDYPIYLRRYIVGIVERFAKKRDKFFTPFKETYSSDYDPKDVVDYVYGALSDAAMKSGGDVERMTMKVPEHLYAATQEEVMPLYARVNNPLKVGFDTKEWTPDMVAKILLTSCGAHDYTDDLDIIGGSQSGLPHVDLTEKEQRALQKTIERIDAHHRKTQEYNNTDPVYQKEWDRVERILRGKGYDGIRYTNSAEGNTSSGDNYSYLVFSPQDLKSANPVTRDEDGEIIPLSERFPGKEADTRGLVKSKKNETEPQTKSPPKSKEYKELSKSL